MWSLNMLSELIPANLPFTHSLTCRQRKVCDGTAAARCADSLSQAREHTDMACDSSSVARSARYARSAPRRAASASPAPASPSGTSRTRL